MIFGIGTDIVEVARMEASISQFGHDLAKRILAENELAGYEDMKTKDTHLQARFLAKRFAAKEAFSKALGTGLRAPATMQNIAVSHDDLGKPILVLAEELQAFLLSKNITKTHISISDEKNLAVAFVALET
ncbi:MAG TPA: holo-ACP synthase [Methylotenera sp.]|nr:holo-ACP synthase [Methylotenera sp.]HPH06511.1 holo-ACP synthase [Methylotenera sp.]HPN02002.1 holo-ACP synthase [Methylotenera sp.]